MAFLKPCALRTGAVKDAKWHKKRRLKACKARIKTEKSGAHNGLHSVFTQGPNRSPAERVRFGKEEQRHERALTFEKKSEQAIWSLLRRGAGVQNGHNQKPTLNT